MAAIDESRAGVDEPRCAPDGKNDQFHLQQAGGAFDVWGSVSTRRPAHPPPSRSASRAWTVPDGTDRVEHGGTRRGAPRAGPADHGDLGEPLVLDNADK